MQLGICFQRASRNGPFYMRHIQVDRVVHSAVPYPHPCLISNSSETGKHHTLFSLSFIKTVDGEGGEKASLALTVR